MFDKILERFIRTNDFNSFKNRYANIKGKFNINALNASGLTLLHIAALEGRSDCVDFLLAEGADVTLKSIKEGNTALILASDNGYESIVKSLSAAFAKSAASSPKAESVDTDARVGTENAGSGPGPGPAPMLVQTQCVPAKASVPAPNHPAPTPVVRESKDTAENAVLDNVSLHSLRDKISGLKLSFELTEEDRAIAASRTIDLVRGQNSAKPGRIITQYTIQAKSKGAMVARITNMGFADREGELLIGAIGSHNRVLPIFHLHKEKGHDFLFNSIDNKVNAAGQRTAKVSVVRSAEKVSNIVTPNFQMNCKDEEWIALEGIPSRSHSPTRRS